LDARLVCNDEILTSKPETDMTMTREDRIEAYVAAHARNGWVASILAILFGPVGYLYSSVLGGVIAILLAIGLSFSGFGIFNLFLWIVCIIAAPFEVQSQNKKLRARAELMAAS
jgi:hypothetical protein